MNTHPIRVAFYAAVAVVAVLAHTGVPAALAGDGIGDLLRRNSEAYLMILLVPLYWDLHASLCHPDGLTTCDPKRRLRHQFWYFGALVAGVVLTETGVPETLGWEVPDAINTLGEAFVAALVVGAYVGVTHGIMPPLAPRNGAPAVSVRVRVGAIAAAVLGTALLYQDAVRSWLGQDAVAWLHVNAESYAAIIVLMVYFGFVAQQRQPVRSVWYVALLAVPFGVQAAGAEGALLGWLERTTEGFIAAAVVAIYFDLLRPIGRPALLSHGRPAG